MRKWIQLTCLVVLVNAAGAWATINSEGFLAANGYTVGGLREQANSFWDATGSTATTGILDLVDYIPNGTDFGLKLTVNTTAGTAGANGRTDFGGGNGWGGPGRGGQPLRWSMDIQKGTGTYPAGSNIWQTTFIRNQGGSAETFFAFYGTMDSVGVKITTGNGTASPIVVTLPTHALSDNWNRVCVLNDLSQTTSDFQFYLNGVLVNTYDLVTNSGGSVTGIPLLRGGAAIGVDQVIIERLNRGANEAGWNATMGFDNILTANEALDCAQPPATALIPEPAALTLMGLAGLGLAKRRRLAA